MAFTEIVVSSDWKTIGESVSEMTFQNKSPWPIEIAFTSGSSEPTEERSVTYLQFEGEEKKTISELSYIPGANYVWARCVTNRTNLVIVEYPGIETQLYVFDGYVDSGYVEENP